MMVTGVAPTRRSFRLRDAGEFCVYRSRVVRVFSELASEEVFKADVGKRLCSKCRVLRVICVRCILVLGFSGHDGLFLCLGPDRFRFLYFKDSPFRGVRVFALADTGLREWNDAACRRVKLSAIWFEGDFGSLRNV